MTTTPLVSPDWFALINPQVHHGGGGSSIESMVEAITWNDQSVNAVSDEWIVQLNASGLSSAQSVLQAGALLSGNLNFELVGGLGLAGQILIRSDAVTSEIASWLGSHWAVEYYEPNLVSTFALAPNDPSFTQLYGLHNTGQTGGLADADIDAPEAWEITTGSDDVVIAVVDTGVNYTHSDLVGNIWTNPNEIAGNLTDDDGNGFVDDVHGYDFVNEDGNPIDDQGHGTHVAGTIAAVGDNNIGVTGVSWNASIMALKFLSSSGSGTTSNAIRAINYATMMRSNYGVNVRATNNSWGGGGFSQSLSDAIGASGAADILFVAAAGNNSRNTDTTAHYPSSYPLSNIISVASTNHNDQLSSFSNYGSTTVDLGAPGEGIYSADKNGGYSTKSGTSMASPHVSGVVALLASLAPGSTAAQIKAAILEGADPIASLAGKTLTGGRLNARGAIDRLNIAVASSSPGNGDVIATPPVDFTISFNREADTASIQASDLSVNGIAADSVTIVNSQTAIFHYNASPVASEGLQTMEIAEGAVLQLTNGAGIGAWHATFRYDALSTAVVATTPLDGSTVASVPTEILVQFNEAIDPSTVSASDLVIGIGTVTGATLIAPDTIRFAVSGIYQDGQVSLTLASGALTDLQGGASASYAGSFDVDTPLFDRFASADVPKPVGANQTIISSLSVTTDVLISDLNVELTITGAVQRNISAFLIAPDGTRIELLSAVPTGNTGISGTLFDDEAPSSINLGTGTLTGLYQPDGLLSDVDGKSTIGTWQLEITNNDSSQTATLTSWALRVDSNPDVAPRITRIDPFAPRNSKTWDRFDHITVHFSKFMNIAAVTSTANWELIEAGADKQFDTSDDNAIAFTIGAYTGGLTVDLTFAGDLPAGSYRLRATGLEDAGGLLLDGDGNGTGGDAFTSVFAVQPKVAGAPSLDDFETGLLAGTWEIVASPFGNLRVTSSNSPIGGYHLVLDSTRSYAGPQQAILHADLAGRSGLTLTFWQKKVGTTTDDTGDGIDISADGETWYRVLDLTGGNTSFSYLKMALDLDAAIANAGISYTDNFQIRFSQDSGSGTSGFGFDNIEITTEDRVGPRVLSVSPTESPPGSGPVNSFILTFSEAMDIASLHAGTVTIANPIGDSVSFTASLIPGSGGTQLELSFADQSIVGTYTLSLTADVSDAAGNLLNQDQDAINGETTDGFSTTITRPPTAFDLGAGDLVQDFESWSTVPAAWSFSSPLTGFISISNAAPHSDTNSLRMGQDGGSGYQHQHATLLMDLSDFAGFTGLTLDFWAKNENAQNLGYSELAIRVSGNGTLFHQIESWRPETSYRSFGIDLDSALTTLGIAMDGDVYIQFEHQGLGLDQSVFIDDVRVSGSGLDVLGAKVTSVSPTGGLTAPYAGAISITFSEQMNAASFTAADVMLTGPSGAVVSLLGDPVDSGDHRTFTLMPAFPLQLGGTYKATIGPNVLDLAGNAMDGNGDNRMGEPTDASAVTLFTLSPSNSLPAPYVEGFEISDIHQLAGWSFSPSNSTGAATIGTTHPHSGSRYLKMGPFSGGTAPWAAAQFDLSSYAGATDVSLDFWLRSSFGPVAPLILYFSDDGLSWNGANNFLLDPTPTAGAYYHYAVDLDQLLANASVELDSDVYIRFAQQNSSSYEIDLDDVRISRSDVTGPTVLSVAPSGATTGPVSSLTVTFSEDMNAASFTSSDIVIASPSGQQLALSGNPVDSGDHRTFTLNLATPIATSGTYAVAIASTITDLSGNPLNQDGDMILGESTDGFSSSFSISASPTPVPFTEGFESGNLSSLANWSFNTTGTGQFAITTASSPYAGSYHLAMTRTSTATSTHSAVLALDLSQASNPDELYLDFWTQQVGVASSSNQLTLSVSGDGGAYVVVPGATINPGVVNQYTHYSFDLDSILTTAGIALDADVFIKFFHSASGSSTATMTLDDVRVGYLDQVGPKIASHTPMQSGASVGTVSVTFNEAINPASFTSADVTVTMPWGQVLSAAATPTDSGDQKTFQLQLNQSLSAYGNYIITIGPAVQDANGNSMDQNGDGLLGGVSDTYAAAISLLTIPVPQQVSYVEGFEPADIGALAGWNFTTAGKGIVSLATTNAPHGGARHLVFSQTTSAASTEEAILALDLSGVLVPSEIFLDFWSKELGSLTSMSLYVSGDRLAWSLVASNIDTVLNAYTHFAFDLDDALSSASIQQYSDVFIKFVHSGSSTNGVQTIDDLSVNVIDIIGPAVVTLSPPAGPTTPGISSFQVTFSEPIDSSTFTASSVFVKIPTGSGGTPLLGDPIDSGDHMTFTLNLAQPLIDPGTHQLSIFNTVRDLAGNRLNQDRDGINGETVSDQFDGYLLIGTEISQGLPYQQSFESGDITNLPGWTFGVPGPGSIRVSDINGPMGNFHLEMYHPPNVPIPPTGDPRSTDQATLKLDLSPYVGTTNLYLDFWLKVLGSAPVTLQVSNNATAWSSVVTLNPTSGQYVHYAYDLDQLLASKSIVLNNSVYVRWSSNSSATGGGLSYLDDVRVGTQDVLGPRITASTPSSSTIAGPISSVGVTFSEAIDASTFTASDISFVSPWGSQIPLAGDPIDSGDHRNFTIQLASPHNVAGSYVLTIGSDVRDLAGNLLDQNNNGVAGELSDSYSRTWTAGTQSAATLPFTEGFEAADFHAMSAWRFSVNANGTIELTNADNPLGSTQLKFDQLLNGNIREDAILKLNLSSYAGATDLILDFWAKQLGSSGTNVLQLAVSGDGSSYDTIDGSVEPSLPGEFVYYAYDLDAQLAAEGIAVDQDVFIRFRHTGSTVDSEMSLDDIRVFQGTVNFNPTLTSVSTLTGGTEDTPYTVTYAALATAANEADPEGAPIGFRIESVWWGTLTKDGIPIVPGVTILSEGESLLWTPPSNVSGSTGAFTIRAWDGFLASQSPELVTVSLASVNDAPVLDPQLTLPLSTISEDNVGASSLISSFATLAITDVETSIAGLGIAVVGLTGLGDWQYSTNNGATWTTFSNVSDNNALLLRGIDLVRFNPATDYNGAAAISYRGWDRAVGVQGTFIALPTPVDSSGFSANVGTSQQIVLPVNDRPTAHAGGPYVINEGSLLTLDASASFDIDGDPLEFYWDLNSDGVFGDVIGENPTLDEGQLVYFGLQDGAAQVNIRVQAIDTIGVVGTSGPTTVTVTNQAPAAFINGPNFGLRGTPINYSLSGSDASFADQAAGFSFEIDWDSNGSIDELVPLGTSAVSHTFDALGSNQVFVYAIDKDGGRSDAGNMTVQIVPYTVTFNNQSGLHDLRWGGTGGADSVSVTLLDPTTVRIAESLINGSGASNVYTATGVTGKIVLLGQGGDDTLDATLMTTSVEIVGGVGNDVLHGGAGADLLSGDSDNDSLHGGLGTDSISGGIGDDLIYGEIDINEASPPSALPVASSDTIDAGDGADVIYGDSDGAEGAADSILAGAGDDVVHGDGAEGDTLGADTILGGSGNDTITADGGEGASDSIFGEAGDDVIDTGRGNDWADGGLDNDIVIGGDGAEGSNDTLLGGEGRDILIGDGGVIDPTPRTGGADSLVGGAGEDIALAGYLALTDPAVLTQIRSIWTSVDTYEARTTALTTGGAPLLDPGTSLFNDEASAGPDLVDMVLGGSERDWLLVDVASDDTADEALDELITELAGDPLA